uniref:C-X-C motif chemokine n=1 Tax=Nannospalax galili TaxID=1026970 RepID=A0A8C6QAC3_NANGA
MKLRPSATTFCSRSRPPHNLRVLLLLSLLLAALVPTTTGQSHVKDPYLEMRCVCLNSVSGIHPNGISTLELIRPGAHCDKVELIATLKVGKKICLDPTALGVKKIVMKLLEGS